MKINENGRSMVEMLGVLAIIGVLSAGGLAGYSKAMFKHKLNNTIDQITMIVTNVRTMYGTSSSYEGLDDDALKLGVVPTNMINGTSILNPFKGVVTLAAADAKTEGDNQAFTINIGGLPLEACVTIASADWGAGAGSGFIAATAANGETAATWEDDVLVGEGADGSPLAVSDAATACAPAANAENGSNVSNVTLKFY